MAPMSTELARRAPAPLVNARSNHPQIKSPRRKFMETFGVAIGAQAVLTLPIFLGVEPLAIVAVTFAAFALWARLSRKNVRKQISAIDRGRELLEQGSLGEAAQVLDEALELRPRHIGARLQLAHHRALVSLLAGDFPDARARYADILRSNWLIKRRMLHNMAPVVYSAASMAAALDGDLGEAAKLQAEGKVQSTNLARYWYVTDAVILARRGHFEALLRELELHREAAEGTITGVALRRLQLLEAYATHELAKGEDEYRGLHSGTDIAAMLHGIRPGRLDSLATKWPELREFMAAYRLLATA